jgi:hypothetical protein
MPGCQTNRGSATRPTSGLGLLVHGAETDDVRIEVPGLSLPAIKGAFQDHGADGCYVPLRRANLSAAAPLAPRILSRSNDK